MEEYGRELWITCRLLDILLIFISSSSPVKKFDYEEMYNQNQVTNKHTL